MTEEIDIKLIKKYKKLAKKATFTNPFIRRIKDADFSKTLYEAGITTGNSIEGKCIRLNTIKKYCYEYDFSKFLDAIKNRKEYSTRRFRIYGYDGTLWCHPDSNGDLRIGFNKEYRNCGNGYYYLMINDETFIGYDVD